MKSKRRETMIKEEMRVEKSNSRDKEGGEERRTIIAGGGAEDQLEKRKITEK